MLTRIRICLVMLLCGASLNVTASEPLTFITEAYPPYNFSDDNILRGIAVDLLVIASQNTEQPVQRGQIRLMPWARAYRTTLDTPNSVLFPLLAPPSANTYSNGLDQSPLPAWCCWHVNPARFASNPLQTCSAIVLA